MYWYPAAMASQLITAGEAARRLSVKPATLYAYVSRGMVRSHRLAGERGSWFDVDEIDGLARRRGGPGARPTGLDIGIATAITTIDGGRLWYRGRDATHLARTESFESVASLLWTGTTGGSRWAGDAVAVEAAREVGARLGPGARLVDRLAVAVTVAATNDPLRFDLAPPAVTAAGRSAVAVMVDALPAVGPPTVSQLVTGDGAGLVDPIAGRLWCRLAPGPPSALATSVLNAFLVLVADHELATSTLGARLAASTRADPYAVIASALAVLDGPLHGTASDQVVGLLREAGAPGGPAAAIGSWLRQGRPLPGFGHPLYDHGDPRGAAMLDLVASLAAADPAAGRRWELASATLAAVGRHLPAAPNSDFGLGALAFVAGMPADAGAAIFAVGRCAGWIAHALEEYREGALRFRARALYTGVAPGPGRHDGGAG
jgi:citrate synthase